MRMNKTAYEVGNDKLLYDNSHPFDAKNVSITVPEKAVGTLKRGQIIDIDATGKYVVHAASGTVSGILAEEVSYAADDTEVIAAMYISGAFRYSAGVTAVDLTEADEETLRSKGIYLK